MLNKEQILNELSLALSNGKSHNNERIESLIRTVENMSDEQLAEALTEKKIKTLKDVKKFINQKPVQRNLFSKFKPLNELISFGVNGTTLHIHVIPKDASSFLTKDGQKQAELYLIDALEKIKVMICTDKKYKNISNVYAVSSTVSGIVARWFKNLDFDVKTMKMEEAKEDSELKKFAHIFKEQQKLGRAQLSTQVLKSEDWENKKNERKSKLLTPDKSIIETLQSQTLPDSSFIDVPAADKKSPKISKDVI